MCVNKIKLKTAYKKQLFEHTTFLKLHTMTMGQHFLAIFGVLAVNKRRKDWLLTIPLLFFYLIVKT